MLLEPFFGLRERPCVNLRARSESISPAALRASLGEKLLFLLPLSRPPPCIGERQGAGGEESKRQVNERVGGGCARIGQMGWSDCSREFVSLPTWPRMGDLPFFSFLPLSGDAALVRRGILPLLPLLSTQTLFPLTPTF